VLVSIQDRLHICCHNALNEMVVQYGERDSKQQGSRGCDRIKRSESAKSKGLKEGVECVLDCNNTTATPS
jgi:hypothetical protein